MVSIYKYFDIVYLFKIILSLQTWYKYDLILKLKSSIREEFRQEFSIKQVKEYKYIKRNNLKICTS